MDLNQEKINTNNSNDINSYSEGTKLRNLIAELTVIGSKYLFETRALEDAYDNLKKVLSKEVRELKKLDKKGGAI